MSIPVLVLLRHRESSHRSLVNKHVDNTKLVSVSRTHWHPTRSRYMQQLETQQLAAVQAVPEGIKPVQQEHAATGGQARPDTVSADVSLGDLGPCAGQVA